MKKIGIITLTRQNSLAYSVLNKIVEGLGYSPVCGEAIGAECLFFPLEELTLVGYDFLGDLLKRAGLPDSDVTLISVPYSVNAFFINKIIGCLRSISPAPIVIGGNEASNNYKTFLRHRFSAFANRVIDIGPDFVVRGTAENTLSCLLPLLDRTTMTRKWDKGFLKELLDIPNIAFWLPERKALLSTEFIPRDITERDVFAFVRYGEKSIAITLQRACIWAKKSGGGCLFCSIARQFGKGFHSAVQGVFFVDELRGVLEQNPDIGNVDIWDDTFNMDQEWTIKICGYLQELNKKIAREITYSCFLRPKGINEKLAKKMREANIKVAFVGADALTEDLSKRLRRGSTVSELNRTIETLSKAKIKPSLSVQVFSPESDLDDVGITATFAMSCIKNGKSAVHVHLYTFPLFGSDLYSLLESRNNLKKIPSPLMKKDLDRGFEPYHMAYDYVNFDPDVEEIKRKTFKLLDISTSFYVRTYPGDNIDGKRLKAILNEVRNWCVESKKTHRIKSIWYMIILLREDQGMGLYKEELLNALSRNDTPFQIPERLRGSHGDFGYQYTLSASFDEVIYSLIGNGWVQAVQNKKYRLTPEGCTRLRSEMRKAEGNSLDIAAYGKLSKSQLLKALEMDREE